MVKLQRKNVKRKSSCDYHAEQDKQNLARIGKVYERYLDLQDVHEIFHHIFPLSLGVSLEC